jgi:hypothetical protein
VDEEKKTPTEIVVDAKTPTDAGETESLLQPGQWYWVKVKGENEPRFMCIAQLGTNYAKMHGPDNKTRRIHFDQFFERCQLEPNPDRVIESNLRKHEQEVAGLLEQIKAVTASLAIGFTPSLSEGNETAALALRGKENSDFKGYGKSLEKAKKTTLPDLFSQMKDAHAEMAMWMTAKLIPMKVQATGLSKLINAIDDRIFSITLYAGLTEELKRVKDGEPAPLTTKLHLIQRQHYMDEECLVGYETGGMEFKNLEAFDRWLSKPKNFNRVLPFPRCLLSFKVRRHRKDRYAHNILDFFRILDQERFDQLTFLYIRNGAQLWRLSTEIDFDEELFPDMESPELSGKIMAEVRNEHDNVTLMSEDTYKGRLEDFRRREKAYEVEAKEHEEKLAAYKAALKTPEAAARAKELGLTEPDACCVDMPWVSDWGPRQPEYPFRFGEPVPYDKSSVYYDDITAKIQSDIKAHNRIALVVQGLLDRSPALHPHPPWQIWTEAGFSQALVLIYDSARALVPGPQPDFERYRALMNHTLAAGSVTIGQQNAWHAEESEKSTKYDHRPRYGDPGPGKFAKVESYNEKTGMVTYSWLRQRRGYDEDKKGGIRRSFSCKVTEVFNVDAYTPGDFKIFYSDPRTRQMYLKWAPLLIEAEEYKAGNRKDVSEPAPPQAKSPSSWEGQLRYRRQKELKSFLHKAVAFRYAITTKAGTKYAAGSLWRVTYLDRGTLSVRGINEDGTYDADLERRMFGITPRDLELRLDIPDEPKKEKK